MQAGQRTVKEGVQRRSSPDNEAVPRRARESNSAGSEPARGRPVPEAVRWVERGWRSAAAKSLGRSGDSRVSGTTTDASLDVANALLRAAKHSSFRTMR